MTGCTSLSLCLTAILQKPMQCLSAGIDSLGSNRVFKDWAHSWAAQIVVQMQFGALMQPMRKSAGPSAALLVAAASDSDTLLRFVLELPTFERFVFVCLSWSGQFGSGRDLLGALDRTSVRRESRP